MIGALLYAGGASGKVTVAEHRLSVLTAVGSLVQCPLSSAGQQEVATQAAKMLAAHIKQEGGQVFHEGGGIR